MFSQLSIFRGQLFRAVPFFSPRGAFLKTQLYYGRHGSRYLCLSFSSSRREHSTRALGSERPLLQQLEEEKSVNSLMFVLLYCPGVARSLLCLFHSSNSPGGPKAKFIDTGWDRRSIIVLLRRKNWRRLHTAKLAAALSVSCVTASPPFPLCFPFLPFSCTDSERRGPKPV